MKQEKRKQLQDQNANSTRVGKLEANEVSPAKEELEQCEAVKNDKSEKEDMDGWSNIE